MPSPCFRFVPLAFFTSPCVALAGWIHHVIFDLFIGAWEVRDAQRRGDRAFGAVVRRRRAALSSTCFRAGYRRAGRLIDAGVSVALLGAGFRIAWSPVE